MNHTKKHQVLKMFTATLFIIAFAAYAFPRWFANASEKAFDETGQGSASVSLEDLIKAGAGYFLDSYANTMSFLKESERAPNNELKPGLALLLGKALKGMEKNETKRRMRRYQVSVV